MGLRVSGAVPYRRLVFPQPQIYIDAIDDEFKYVLTKGGSPFKGLDRLCMHRQVALADIAGFAKCLQIGQHGEACLAPWNNMVDVEDDAQVGRRRTPTCHAREAISAIDKKPESPRRITRR